MIKRRKIVVLNMPVRINDVIIYTRQIVVSMSTSAYLPTPTPDLATVTTNIQTLYDAQVDMVEGDDESTAARDTALKRVHENFNSLKSYIQNVADQNLSHAEEIILSSGMSVKNAGGKKQQIFEAEIINNSSIKLYAPVPKGKKAYAWLKSTDNVDYKFAGVSSRADIVLTGLIPGSLYYFIYVVTVNNVQRAYSEPISCYLK